MATTRGVVVDGLMYIFTYTGELEWCTDKRNTKTVDRTRFTFNVLINEKK